MQVLFVWSHWISRSSACPFAMKSEECISEAATSLFNVEDGLETLNAKSEGVGMLRFLDVASYKTSVYSDVFRSIASKKYVLCVANLLFYTGSITFHVILLLASLKQSVAVSGSVERCRRHVQGTCLSKRFKIGKKYYSSTYLAALSPSA